MPGLVKIGKTTRDNPQVRMGELYSTGVPVPFECVKAVKVNDEVAVETALHTAFGPNRINSKREFFEIDAIQAAVLLEQLGTQDVTPQINAENEAIDSQSRDAAKRLSSRRPDLALMKCLSRPLNPRGCQRDRKCGGLRPKESHLQRPRNVPDPSTRLLLNLDYSVQPSPYWTFEGELLRDIYNRTYVELDE